MVRLNWVLAGLGLAMSAGLARGGDAVTGEAFDGGKLHYDGVYYDYLDAEARKGMKLWVPPGEGPLRGILFHGNPGGSGDTRNMVRDERLQEFAARHRLGIIGVVWFPGRNVYPETGAVMIRVLDDWAKLGDHPELANVPLIARGSSNAGMTAYGLMCRAPGRMVCITPNVGPRYNPPVPPDAALAVPAWMHIGPEDPLVTGGVESTTELFADARPRGARWAWDAEQGKGHEIGHIDDVDLWYYVVCLEQRLPADADGRQGPVALKPLPLEDGWLADPDSWRSGMTHVAPWAEYDRDRTAAVWLPDAGSAQLYRAIATYDVPLTIRVVGLADVDNPDASGRLLRSVGGRVVEPGTRLAVECDASGLPGWQRIEFFNGAERIGTVTRGQQPRVELTVEPQRSVYALSAIGYDSQGNPRPSRPTHFIVRDPAISQALARQRQAWEDAAAPALSTGLQATGTGVMEATPTPADPDDAVLVSYGLSSGQDTQLTGAEGDAPADFWAQFTDAHDRAELTLRHRSGQAETAPADDGQDVRVSVRAAHSRRGLYLLFEVTDDDWTGGDLNDAVDFHIARTASAELWGAEKLRDAFLSAQYSLAVDAVQYQAPVGTSEPVVARNIPSPWDMRRVELSPDEAAAREGIRVRRVSLAEGRRALEWFLPWETVGVGGPFAEPAAGQRLGLVLGYNDADAGEDGTVNLRWPRGVDPWAHRAEQGPNPDPWGDLEIGGPLQ